MTSAAPQHEPEVLAARNMRVIAEHGLPAGWFTPAEADDLLIANVVDRTAGYAERAFLVTIGLSPKRADKAVTSDIADLFDEVHRSADFLSLAADKRLRFQSDAANLFDRRLAFLRAFAVTYRGHA